ncbi:MAG: hypothetical protein JNL07_06570 [Rhodospirillales bacterium]|nr:hypothetical protein [Rhodospirillales bacterium]
MRPLSTPAAVALAALAAASPAALAQAGAGAPYGARDPVACPSLTQAAAPSAQQAATLVRCRRETVNSGSGELWLMEATRVELGGAQPFASLYNSVAMPGADTRMPVHPIRGSWTWSTCMSMKDAGRGGADPTLNCRETDVGGATGACWRTTAGEWACAMNGSSGATRQRTRAPR